MSRNSSTFTVLRRSGTHLDVEIAALRAVDRDRVGRGRARSRRAVARELAQPAQRDLDVARAELDVVVEVLEFALVPDLDRAAVAALVLADAHAFGIVAVGAERRGAGRADPFAAALVALLLLRETLLQRLHQLVPAAQRLDLLLLLVGQEFLGELAAAIPRGSRRSSASLGQARGP